MHGERPGTTGTSRIKVGVQTWPEHADYADLRRAWIAAEELGVDSIWLWDHFFPLNGDPDGKSLECWALLATLAEVTERVEFGPLVSCAAYRNPHLLADMARTVDHISRGRLILGVGSGWFERDFTEYGFPFDTDAVRLRELERALQTIRTRLATLHPPAPSGPPILIGGTGPRVTLRLVATYAHRWNAIAGPPDELAAASQTLDDWCARIGRPPTDIERSVALFEPEQLADLDAYLAAGFTHFIYGVGGPAYDLCDVEELLEWRDRAR
jgi:probable F420-dependent oxidoreductase